MTRGKNQSHFFLISEGVSVITSEANPTHLPTRNHMTAFVLKLFTFVTCDQENLISFPVFCCYTHLTVADQALSLFNAFSYSLFYTYLHMHTFMAILKGKLKNYKKMYVGDPLRNTRFLFQFQKKNNYLHNCLSFVP